MARRAEMASVLIVTLAFCMSSTMISGQPALAPAPDCSSVILELLPCYQFLSNVSVSTVSPACCGNLSDVSVNDPVCLCALISPSNVNQSASLGINVTRALELPGLCQLNIGPSNCVAILGPSAAPSPLGPSVSPAPAIAPVLAPPPALTPAPVALTPAPVPAAGIVPSITPVSEPSTSTGGSPGPSVDCSTAELTLAPCVQFVTGAEPTPSTTCCTGFDNLVTTSPTCLCSLVASGSTALPGVNATLALELPTLCKVNVSLSSCTAASGPTSSGAGPAESPPSGRGIVVAANLFETFVLVAAAFFVLLQH